VVGFWRLEAMSLKVLLLAQLFRLDLDNERTFQCFRLYLGHWLLAFWLSMVEVQEEVFLDPVMSDPDFRHPNCYGDETTTGEGN
jgi:hypothetical protein